MLVPLFLLLPFFFAASISGAPVTSGPSDALQLPDTSDEAQAPFEHYPRYSFLFFNLFLSGPMSIPALSLESPFFVRLVLPDSECRDRALSAFGLHAFWVLND